MMILYSLLIFFLVTQVWALWQMYVTPTQSMDKLADHPHISILIAARNEEDDILRCLQSIDRLDYPKEKIQVLIGDDASEDGTASIVHDFIQDKSHFEYHYIDTQLGHCVGKANVLAQLAHLARGTWYFYTDADIALPADWIRCLLSHAPQKKILMGFTTIEGGHLFDRMQAIDWGFALGMLFLFMSRQKPVTAMGNNMAVHKDAYWSVGGYEGIPPSIVEDFTLFRCLVSKGHDFVQIIDAGSAALSTPMPTYSALLQQRKRWMKGALQLPWYMTAYLLLQALFVPLLLVSFCFAPWPSLSILSLKMLLQGAFIIKVFGRADMHVMPWELVLYDLYASVQSLVILIYNLLPTGVTWKGRKY